MGDYLLGRMHGERDYNSNPGWIIGGLGCGIFAVAYAAMRSPSPPASLLIGKSPEYIMGYNEAYRDKARSQDTKYALIGWSAWLVILVMAYSAN